MTPLRAGRLVASAFVLFGLLAATGCKKPEDDLGLSVLDPADTLGTTQTDTITVLSWPVSDSPVQTSAASASLLLTANILGRINDDRFGLSTAGIATQVRLSVNNVGPADATLTCDSLIFSLAFATTDPLYGYLDAQTISVYRMAEDLSIDSVYNNDRMPQTENVDLVQDAPRMFTPSPSVGPVIGGDSLVPQLRIPLSTDLGNELLAQWGQPTMADNASFLAFLKGFYVVPGNDSPAPMHGGAWRMNLLSGASKLTLYYHSATDTTSFDFIIGTEGVRYTTAVFDHSAATTGTLPQALADSTLGQVETYVQSLGGLRTEVRFPYLGAYANTPYRALAKAELIVPVPQTPPLELPAPPQLTARVNDSLRTTVPDLSGGFYDAEANEYRLNMTHWMQGILNGTTPNTGISLVVSNNRTISNRTTLAGPTNPDQRMRLVLTFTTY